MAAPPSHKKQVAWASEEQDPPASVQEQEEGTAASLPVPDPNRQRRASRQASTEIAEAIAYVLVPRHRTFREAIEHSVLVPRDIEHSSTPADSVTFLWQTTLIPVLCSMLSIAILYPMSQYTRTIGDLYFGEDGLGAPAIYREPPQILNLPEGSHLAVVPFLHTSSSSTAWSRQDWTLFTTRSAAATRGGRIGITSTLGL